MEWNGSSLVFTEDGRKKWDTMGDETRTLFMECVSKMLMMSSVEVRVNITEPDTLTEVKRLNVSTMNQILSAFERRSDKDVDLSPVNQKLAEIQLALERQVKTIQDKGKEGEQSVLNVLYENLMSSDGYSVEDVSGNTGNCDILVKRAGCCDVRIDVKNWSRKVSQRDVDKFVGDLNSMNCSGIMVSLNDGVVGKRHCEVNQLTNGKFAMYLFNMSDSLCDICEYIRLIHMLESMCKNDDGMVRVGSETLKMIEFQCDDLRNKIVKIKSSLRNTLTMVSDLSIETIARLVKNQEEPVIVPPPTKVVVCDVKCEKCGQGFKSKAGYVSHAKTCHGLKKHDENAGDNQGPIKQLDI